jgi:hypothetical protein
MNNKSDAFLIVEYILIIFQGFGIVSSMVLIIDRITGDRTTNRK